MNIHLMKTTHLILCLIALIFTNCSKNDDNDNSSASTHIVDQVAFLLYDATTDAISYYHNGEVVALNSDNGDVIVKDITIDANTVYAAGNQKINDIWNIALWKNGVLDTNTPTYSNHCYVEAIAIDNGDIYLAGRRIYDGNVIDAAYWRDNTYKVLPKISDKSFANDIMVSNSLVAVAGWHSQPLSPSTASVWENDILFHPNGSELVGNIAYCLYNNGTNPIYGGYKSIDGSFQPTVWDKNGVILTFALAQGKSGQIGKITNFQNDIYTLLITSQLVNGNQTRAVELWKNGLFQETLVETIDGTVRALFLEEVNNDLYYAASSETAVVFKTFENTLDIPIELDGKTIFRIEK